MPILNAGTYSDAHQITHGLWMGSAPPPDRSLKSLGFDRVVLAAMEYQPDTTLFGIRVQYCPLDDTLHLTQAEGKCAKECAASIARGIRRGEKVLVTCQVGRNRSGLVVALTLRDLTGMSGEQAVAIVRGKRPNALTNPHFVSLLDQLGPKPVRPPLEIRRGARVHGPTGELFHRRHETY